MWEGKELKKKNAFYIVALIFFVLILYVVFSKNYISVSNHFSGNLKRITIFSSDEQSAVHVIDDNDAMGKLERAFFNKVTSNIGPSTTEAGNHTITFEFEKNDFVFHLIHTYDLSEPTYIKLVGQGRDYKLSDSEVEFLLDYIQVKSAVEVDQPSNSTDESNEGETIVFNDKIKTTILLKEIHLETHTDINFEKPLFYISGSEKGYFSGKEFEGTVEYNTTDNTLKLSYILSEGKSCLGAMDGHDVKYVVNLIENTISNKVIIEWTGCNEDETYMLKVSDEELMDFAFAVYTTMKSKY